MNLETKQILHSGNRKILNFYWALIGFVVIVGQLMFYYGDRESLWMLGGFTDLRIILIAIFHILLLLLAELLIHYMYDFLDYVIIITGLLISMVILIVASEIVHDLHVILVIPILVSMFYFDSKKLWFAGVLTLCSYFILYLSIYDFNRLVSPIELSIIAVVIVGTSMIGHAVRRRGMELLQSLERAITSREGLIVDTVALEYTSKTDHLTKLYNHITFHEYLNILIQQNETNGLQLQLAILDIDNFKLINDTYGHLQGDKVLQKISSLLTTSISCDDFAARYGGEEFTLVLTGKPAGQSLQIVEALRETIAKMEYPELGHHAVTVSIGITEYVSGLGKDSFFQKADALLYQSKIHGKNMTTSDFGEEYHHEHQK